MVLVKTERAGQRVKANLTTYLDRQLKLPVNEKKSHVAKIDQCVFLGFTFRRGKLRWSDAAFADFKHRIRELTGRSWGVSMQYRFDKLGQYLRGWMGYFGISEYYRPIPELDEWLRRRVRMCYWKQWRHTRTKIGHLLALGVSKRTAILTGISSKRREMRGRPGAGLASRTALVAVAGDANRDDERLVVGAGLGQHP